MGFLIIQNIFICHSRLSRLRLDLSIQNRAERKAGPQYSIYPIQPTRSLWLKARNHNYFLWCGWFCWTCYDDWLDWFLEGDVKVCLKGSVGSLELHLLSGIAGYFWKFHWNAEVPASSSSGKTLFRNSPKMVCSPLFYIQQSPLQHHQCWPLPVWLNASQTEPFQKED